MGKDDPVLTYGLLWLISLALLSSWFVAKIHRRTRWKDVGLALIKVTFSSYLGRRRRGKIQICFPQYVPLPLYTIHVLTYIPHFGIVFSILNSLPLDKCSAALHIFELSLKHHVWDSTAGKWQCTSPVKLCWVCKGKRQNVCSELSQTWKREGLIVSPICQP